MAAPVLFAAAIVLSKVLLGSIEPVFLAGGLYLGSGVGLGIFCWGSRLLGRATEAPLAGKDVPWLAAAIVLGGVVGPLLLMLGLRATPAATASLLLNLEVALTALVAVLVFHEQIGLRGGLAIALVAAGGMALTWTNRFSIETAWGSLAIAGACLSWALDNNLSQRVSAKDPVQIAAIKGLAAGAFNVLLALVLGAKIPGTALLLAMACVGFFGYGVSLVCFMRSLRNIGIARTSMYFALAPFLGAIAGVVFLKEPLTAQMAVAAVLMGLGAWSSLSERHEHEHVHREVHEHRHSHDPHHRHEHGADAGTSSPHSHSHSHAGTTHSHPHDPDIHHREHH